MCEPSNYRPVSLTSGTCKLMEHIIYSQVMKHYTKHNFINGVQHVFLKCISCDTRHTVEELQRGIDKKAQYDVIVLDFQKPFDKVSHRHLVRKLHAGGVRGKLHKWMATCIPSAENTEGSGRWCDVTGSQCALGCPTGNSARAPVVPDVHQCYHK